MPDLITAAIEMATNFINTIVGKLPDFLNTGANVLLKLVDGIVNNFPSIVTAAITGVIEFIATIAGRLPEIIRMGMEIIGKLVVGLLNAIPKIIAAIPKIISSAKEKFLQFDWGQLGRSIIEGIVKGIKNLGSLIGDTLKSLASSAWQGVKNFLGIGSPSRVFADKIGQWIPAGIAMGIENNADTVQDAMDDISGMATGALTSEMVMAANAQAAQIGVDNVNTGMSLEASLLTIIDLLRQGKVLSIDGDVFAATLAPNMDIALGTVAVRKERG